MFSCVSSCMSSCASQCTKIVDFIAPVNPVTERRGVRLIPEWAETSLGTVMYSEMLRSEGGIIGYGDELGRISTVFDRLKPHTKRTTLPYEVNLVRKNSINAWCMPGGKVAVYEALAKAIEGHIIEKKIDGYHDPVTNELLVSYDGITSEHVYAALLGHEMTHADARHTARKLEWTGFLQLCVFGASAFIQACIQNRKSKITSNLSEQTTADKSKLSMLNGLQAIHDVAFKVLIKLSIKLYHLFGSRQHEYEADKYGTQLAKRAGYDWRGALYLQEILKIESGSSWTDSCPSLVKRAINLLSSHPSCKDRQAAIYKEFSSSIPK